MLSGDTCRTTSHTVTYWWESEGHNRDRMLGNPVATWIGKNSKALDRKESLEVAKLIREQFPYLKEIEVRHAQLMHARL